MMASVDLQQGHNVLDVLSRVVRIECEIFSQKHSIQMATQFQNSALAQLQDISQSQNNALVQLQSSMQQVLGLVTTFSLPPPPVGAQLLEPVQNVRSAAASVPPTAPLVLESSPEAHDLCPYPGCTATVLNCSAAKSLRHMQCCVHCPIPFQRYLDIARHMCTFQKHPKVVGVDTCCWCSSDFIGSQSSDARSRHRSTCRDFATVCLQVQLACSHAIASNSHLLAGREYVPADVQ